MKENRILIISHLAMNNTNNVGKTLLSIFNDFKKSELIQLYFNPILPNIDKCISWFRITDMAMLRSLFGRSAGEEHKFSLSINKDNCEFYNKNIGKSTSKLLIRDFVWKIGRKNQKLLNTWLDTYKPKIIFLAPGNNSFPYSIALEISKKRSIPIITFLMDDFYFEQKSNSVLEKIRNLKLKKSIRKIIAKSSVVFACSHEMAINYQKIFDKHIDVLYTPIIKPSNYNKDLLSISTLSDRNKNSLNFLYAGSLGLGRWEILLKIGKILESNYPHSNLNIYAKNIYKDELKELSKCPNIHYGGFLSSEDLDVKISLSDVILHVESFEKERFVRIRYSVSTKIPECLASGKIFLAVGPNGQSGLEYLERNNAAFVCHDDNQLENYIAQIHTLETYSDKLNNARKLLKKNHSSSESHILLNTMIDKILNS